MKKLILMMVFFVVCSQVKAQTSLTTAVDFTVITVHGDTINLFDILDNGQHVLVDFFFTTCGPCIASVPDLNILYNDYGCNTGDVFMVSIDNGDTDQEVLNYELQHGAQLPAASGIEGGGNAVITAYGITAYPTIILIAPNRQIIEQDIWPFSAAIGAAAFLSAGINNAACPAVGIEESDVFTELIAYPNPVSEQLNIGFELIDNSVVQFEILDASGKLVQSEMSRLYTAGQHTEYVNTSDIATGMYFLNVLVDGKVRTHRKISIIN